MTAAGDWTMHGEALQESGLVRESDCENLVNDYGVEIVGRWLEKLEQDRSAITRVIRGVRRALDGHAHPAT